MLTERMFRLLPMQVLLFAVVAANNLIDGFFASNYIGVEAMGAVGLYAPLVMLLGALSNMLIGGSSVLCGRYAGMNDHRKMLDIFSLDLIAAMILGFLFTAMLLVLGGFDLTGFITGDKAMRQLFNKYLLGQSIGIFPYVIGNQLPAYLALENRNRTTTAASLACMIANILFNLLLVNILGMGVFGLALSTSLSAWSFLIIESLPFLSRRVHFRIGLKEVAWRECLAIVRIGYPGAATYIFQTIRGFTVNWLIAAYVGSAGISAFAAANAYMSLFWCIPSGMFVVSRLMISVSIGAEDRQTLTDVMRVMFRRFIPLQCLVSAAVIIFAVPEAGLFFHDPKESVFMMTAWGFRILPLCMPFSVMFLHFLSYGQASGRSGFVNILSVLDGVADVVVFSAILMPFMGIRGVYVANVLNGVVTTLFIIGYACAKNHSFPRDMEQLMAIPEDFGAPLDKRMDITIRSIEEAAGISEEIQTFCLDRGIDRRKAHLAGLAMEEMAGNVVQHGFTKDSRAHSVDIRVALKDDDVIMLIRDDCVPFDPAARKEIEDGGDAFSNIGLRIVFNTAKDVQYMSILGMNMLTIKI